MLDVTAKGMFQPHTRLFKSFLQPEKSVLVFLPLLLLFPNLIISHMAPLPPKIKAGYSCTTKDIQMESKNVQDQEDIGSAQLHYRTAPSVKHAASHFRLPCVRQIGDFSPMSHRT